MSVLILYATVEGQTRKIAQFVEDEIRKTGREASTINVDDTTPISLEGVRSLILAAPVHQRRHPRQFEAFLAGKKSELGGTRTLLLSVSMNAAFPEGVGEAGEYLTEMKMRTGFEPDAEALVAGAVRTSEYDFYAMQVIQHVVMRGREFDRTASEHEFTDWVQLAEKVSSFLEGS